MRPADLRYDVLQDLYQSQRQRREEIRNSVATPVATLAFSVYAVATLSSNFDAGGWDQPVNLVICVAVVLAVLFLLGGALLIMRVERGLVYVDPPDLEELVYAEDRLRENDEEADDEMIAERMSDMLTGAYDIVYRRYFAANEQAARDRTRGLHLVLIALSLILVALCLLPFQSGSTS